MYITSCSGDSLLRGREDRVIHRSRVHILEPAHVEPFHSSLSSDGTQKRISMHSFIQRDSTFAYPVLHNVLYNIVYRRVFFLAFSFALAFAFVTELLAAVFELCPLLSFLAAPAFRKSSSVVLGESAGMRKGTLLSGRGRSPVGT
jgi:hypothetical protein